MGSNSKKTYQDSQGLVSVLQSNGFVWNDGYYAGSAFAERLLTDLNCQHVRTPFFFFFLCGHLCQNMFSNFSSLLRDMFITCLISQTSPRNVKKTFVSFLLFSYSILSCFVVFDPPRSLLRFHFKLVWTQKWLYVFSKCLLSNNSPGS